MPLLDDPWMPTDGDGNPLAWGRAPLVKVYRYDGASSLFELPNVECLSIAHREGTDPGHALFRYNFTSGLDGSPASFDQALDSGFNGAYVVNPGDWLVVRALRPDGVAENLFSGIAQDFGFQVGPESEEVSLGFPGIAKRCWDDVIGGAIIRDGDDPERIHDVRTDLPAHFNPQGVPNCIPDDAMAGSQSGGKDSRYPTFLDASIVRTPDARTYWTLPKALRYILSNANPKEKFVRNPDGADLDDLLVAPGDAPVADRAIRCPDTPITGRDWPGTVYRLIADCGFGMNFALDPEGDPVTRLEIFANQARDPKKLYLAAPGTPFDPTQFNFSAGAMSRDVSDVVNTVKVKGGPTRIEAGFVLAPGFTPSPTDATANALADYDDNDQDAVLDRDDDAYRVYHFGEAGDAFWSYAAGAKVETEATDLDDLLGEDKYARRRRPAIGDLISRDEAGKPRDAQLWISRDYGGPKPGLWDGTGTWQLVTGGGWELLKDRLGVRLTIPYPNYWEVGPSSASGAPYPSGVVNAIEDQAETTETGTTFHLRLTGVIEADLAMTQVAGPTAGTPLPYAVTRVVDASDRYRVDQVHNSSEFYPKSTASESQDDSGIKFKTVRDDSKAALAEAQAIRAGSEKGVLSGSISIPRLTTYYRIGDRISDIEGRNLGLRTDGGDGDPTYPVVVGRSFRFSEDGHSTTLEVSDVGTTRARQKRAAGARSAGRMARRGGRENRRGGSDSLHGGG